MKIAWPAWVQYVILAKTDRYNDLVHSLKKPGTSAAPGFFVDTYVNAVAFRTKVLEPRPESDKALLRPPNRERVLAIKQ